MIPTHVSKLSALAASIPLAAGALAQAQVEYRYAIINVGDPGGRGSEARAINDSGVVIGSTSDSSSENLEAFVWKSGSYYYLPPLADGDVNIPFDINDHGDVVGRSFTERIDIHAVLWPVKGGIIDLGTLGGLESVANGINSLGHIVGDSDLPVSGSNPFLWIDGNMKALGDLGEPGGGADAINDRGQVVGYVTGDPEGGAFLWENGQMVNLGALVSNRRSFAEDINESELIVGRAEVLDYTTRAVIWRSRNIVNIHDNRLGVESGAQGVNDAGQVVGWLAVDDFPLVFGGFLYEGNGPMVSLDSLLPPRHKWERIESAFDINDHGEIVGRGYRLGDVRSAYLITPIVPTLTLLGPQPGNAGTVNGLRLTGCTPGARVRFYYSQFGGGTLVPGCHHTDGVTLQLENPILAGAATANQNGVATLTRFIPPAAQGRTFLIQALESSDCKISQLVVHTFE